MRDECKEATDNMYSISFFFIHSKQFKVGTNRNGGSKFGVMVRLYSIGTIDGLSTTGCDSVILFLFDGDWMSYLWDIQISTFVRMHINTVSLYTMLPI